MPLGDEPCQAHHRVVPDLVELSRGVAVPEVRGPAAQEQVDVNHDLLDGEQQPWSHRQFTDTVTGMLHGPARGPSGQERDVTLADRSLRAHQTVVEAEKVQPLTPDLQVHDPGLGRLGLEPKIAQQNPQPLQGGLGLLPGCAHHHQVVGIPD